jgi:hypothetical protein
MVGAAMGMENKKMECFFSGDGVRGRTEKEEAVI